MPKLPRAPRVSIVIPLQRNPELFEDTLLSVLENQPEQSEVVAVHNGTYSDPFELGDEVNFVTARSSNLVDSIRDAFDATTAPVVHVLSAGLKASPDWTTATLDRFDDCDVAAVSPTVIDSTTGQATSLAWEDIGGRLCQPVSASSQKTRSRRNNGFYVESFFIRRRLLGNLLDAVAPAMNDSVAVSYAFGSLLNRAGWKTELSSECQLASNSETLDEDLSDAPRGQRLAAIHARIFPKKALPGWTEMLSAAILGSSSLAEMFGMLRHRSEIPAMRRAIDPECVATADELARVLNMPTQQMGAIRAAA